MATKEPTGPGKNLNLFFNKNLNNSFLTSRSDES